MTNASVTRRTLLGGLAAPAILGLSGRGAQAAAGQVTIGALSDLSSAYADISARRW